MLTQHETIHGMKTDGEPMMTVQDVMRFLQISRSTVYRLIDQGVLKPYRPGPRSPRFKREDIEEFLKQPQTK